MSYREVDFNVVMDACYHWLKDYDYQMNNYLTELDNRKWWSTQSTDRDRQMAEKEYHAVRVRALLTLSKCPGSLNRIIHLSHEDAVILFGEMK